MIKKLSFKLTYRRAFAMIAAAIEWVRLWRVDHMQFATLHSIENAGEREQPQWLILRFKVLRIAPHQFESHPIIYDANDFTR